MYKKGTYLDSKLFGTNSFLHNYVLRRKVILVIARHFASTVHDVVNVSVISTVLALL